MQILMLHVLRMTTQFRTLLGPRIMLELDTEKEGFMSYKDPEDAQRPRALYDINPDFRGI